MSNLAQDLALLEARGLMRVTTDGENPVVRFKHALTREATYNSILQSRRNELHCAVAQTLLQFHQQLDLELVLSIAEHQLRCGDTGGLADFLLPFAQRLIYTGRSTPLIDVLLQLPRAELGAPQLREIDLALADAHAARGEYERARDLYAQLLPRADADALRARLRQSLGAANYHLGDYANALEHYRASLALAQAQGDIALQAKSHGGIGLVHLALGETARAENFLRTSRDLGMQLGEGLELAAAEYNLGGVQRLLGQYPQAIESIEHALMLEEKFGHVAAAARSLQLLGACYHSMGALETAIEYYNRAIGSSRAIGDFEATAIVQSNLAELHAELNELDTAANLYDDSTQYFRAAALEFALAYNLAGQAHVQFLQAQKNRDAELLTHAQRMANDALEIARRIHSPEVEGIAYRVRAEIAAGQNDLSEAERCAQASVDLMRQIGSALELKRAYRTYAEILNQSADPDARARAAAYFERAEKG